VLYKQRFVLDVILVNKTIFGKAELSEDAIKLIDFNQNDKPDFSDSLIMMRKIVAWNKLSQPLCLPQRGF